MKTKKIIVSILTFLITMICFAFISDSNAASGGGLGYLKITKERKATEYYEPNTAVEEGPYEVTYKHQLYSDDTLITKNVWKIVPSNEIGGDVTTKLSDLYCLRAGLGFTNITDDSNSSESVLYDQEFKMDEAGYKAIQEYLYKYSTGGTDESAKITIFKEDQIDNMNAALWILDNMLLEDATDTEMKAYLSTYAGYTLDDNGEIVEEPLTVLSRADIEAIQQLALWYFTNQDEIVTNDDSTTTTIPSGYQNETLPTLRVNLECKDEEFYNTDEYEAYLNIFTVLDNNGDPQDYGSKRQDAAEKLYESLVTGAKNAAVKVASDTVTDTDVGLYETTRDVTVYLANETYGAAVQQPVVQVREKEADIALRKFISKVGEDVLTGSNSREPKVDTSKFNTLVDGVFQTTAIYNHPKNPVSVEVGDIVTYTIRLYNEGEVPAYIKGVTDYLPKWLDFDYTDTSAYWLVDEDDSKIVNSTKYCKIVNAGGNLDFEELKTLSETDSTALYLGNVEIPAATKDEDGNWILSYVDIEIRCEVLEGIPNETPQTNIAEVTSMTADKEGLVSLADRDSSTGTVQIPDNETNPDGEDYRPNYTGGKNDQNLYYDGSNVVKGSNGDKYYPGQQDDDDFDKVEVGPSFDLALRKFITGINDTSVNNRYPVVTYKDGTFTYTHTKEPLLVATSDIVTYTIRVYNEGGADGYVNEITDDLPEGIEFLPNNKTNIEYRWKMLDENEKETTDVTKAKYIVTDYLSEDQEKETGRDNKLLGFDEDEAISDTNPDYRDVKVAFKVTYAPKTKEQTGRIIVNVAQISADSDDDIDSVPSRDEEYDPSGKNEDDIDYDNIMVKYFDLALLKWVSQTQVTLNGNTTLTNTGHTAETARNEDAVKLEIAEKDINNVVIKYVYTIQVTNEGELEGYATELRDHIPEGLKFIEEDNKDYRWIEDTDGTITTDYLKDTLLKPGDTAEVKLILTWINSKENFGEKINYAEISEDKNQGDVPDIDSTPDNMNDHPGYYEDDEDDAPVIITLKTGTVHIYFTLIVAVLATFSTGVILIKKYVL